MWISRKKYNEMLKEMQDLKDRIEFLEKEKTSWKVLYEDTVKSMSETLLYEDETKEERELLRAIIENDILTKKDLCKGIGIGFQTLQRFLEGNNNIMEQTSNKIAKYVSGIQENVKIQTKSKSSETICQKEKTS